VAIRAMVEISEGAEKDGLSDMTLDEINADIDVKSSGCTTTADRVDTENWLAWRS